MINVNYRVIYLFLISIAFVFCTFIDSFAQEKKGINFIKPKNWEEVLSIARTQHKSIFIDIYTTWCGPCKAMDNNVYPDSALGILINKDFIAVKIQMDSSKNDNAYVRSWYVDAKKIMQSAKIEAFPTLLFYAPDGKMLLKAIGYKDVPALITIAIFAGNTDVAAQYNKDLDGYKNGARDYFKMIALNRFVKQVLQDNKLALQIAKDYKTGFLDNASIKQFYTKENIAFIRENGIELVNINDMFFNLCYNEPEKIDTILEKGAAEQYVSVIISRDEVQRRLYKDGKAITKNPDWREIINVVKTHYTKTNADNLIFEEKLSFYRRTKQWDLYTLCMSEKIKKEKLSPENAFYALNDPAWTVFKNAEDKIALQRALEWSELSIHLDDNLQFYDTKANLLYKLGRKDEAIKTQRIAVKKNEELFKKEGRNWFPEYEDNLSKMLNGKPTWPTK